MFDEIFNNLSGGGETVTGEVPLTVTGTGEPLKEYSITGSTVQDGVPTPEQPVPVKMVGDRTENILPFTYKNYNYEGFGCKITCDDNQVFHATGIPTGLAGGPFLSHLRITDLGLKPGDKFVFRWISTNVMGLVGQIIGLDITGKEYIISSSQNNMTYTVSENLYELTFVVKRVSNNIPIDGEIKFMLSKGSDILPYEPYGYRVPVVTMGKNLFDKSSIRTGWYTATTKSFLLTDIMGRFVTVAVKPNTTYCLTRKYFASPAERNSVILTSEYPIHGTAYNSIVSRAYTEETVVFTTGKSDRYASVMFARGATEDEAEQIVQNIQLTEGAESLPYEPYHEPITTPIYLPTPLAKDEVLKSDGSRDVKWAKYICTGDEALTLHHNFSDHASVRLPVPFQIRSELNGGFALSTHLKSVAFYELYESGKSGVCVHRDIQNSTVYIACTNMMSVADYKQYLKQQYEAGTPVTVYYQLATPTTVTIPDMPTIPTVKGTTVIDVDTEVKPESMTVTTEGKGITSEKCSYLGKLYELADYYGIEHENKTIREIMGLICDAAGVTMALSTWTGFLTAMMDAGKITAYDLTEGVQTDERISERSAEITD